MAHRSLNSLPGGGPHMMRRILTVAATSSLLLTSGAAAAFASDQFELCYVDPVSGSSSASGISLASTGSGIDVGTWLIVGIALLALGATLAIISPGRRPADTAHIAD